MSYIRIQYLLDEDSIRAEWLDPTSPSGLSKEGREHLTLRNGLHPNVPLPWQVPSLSIRRVDDDGQPLAREQRAAQEPAIPSNLEGIGRQPGVQAEGLSMKGGTTEPSQIDLDRAADEAADAKIKAAEDAEDHTVKPKGKAAAADVVLVSPGDDE